MTFDEWYNPDDHDHVNFPHESMEDAWNASRAMSKSTATLPRRLTAENGAKKLLIGEFVERSEKECPMCLGDTDELCECCDGEGAVVQETPVSWPTIKHIYTTVVEHFDPESKETVETTAPEGAETTCHGT